MRKSFLFILLFGILLLAAGLACDLSSGTSEPPGTRETVIAKTVAAAVGAPPGENTQAAPPVTTTQPKPAVQPTVAPSPTLAPSPSPTPTQTPIPSEPVGFQKGLRTFDSYRVQVSFKTISTGPNQNDRTEVTNLQEYSKKDDAGHTRLSSLNSTLKEPSTKPSITEMYRVGLVTCQKSGDDSAWKSTKANEASKDFQEAFGAMFDITPIFDKPTLVGPEEMNGIKTNHFTFKVAGLGNKSGYVVTKNEGHYWMALDGRYLVKYTGTIEMRAGQSTDTNASTFQLELAVDVKDINKPVSIQLPAACPAPK